MINETAGDGLMILFLNEVPEDHARAASLIHAHTKNFGSLTERETTGNFFSVLRHRFLIVILVLFFSLFGFLIAFAACLVETEVQAKSAQQIPTSISCLDSEVHPFLSTIYHPGHKNSSSPKIGERPADAYHIAFLYEGPSYGMALRRLGPKFLPLTVPIYQLKAVYLI